jgi:hypothetical protein
MEIPFDGIVTFFLFIIGVPALVLQFLSPEERRVVLGRRFWLDCILFVVLALAVVLIFVGCRGGILKLVGKDWIWGLMYFCLFVVAGLDGFYIPYHYGRREQIVRDLSRRAGWQLKNGGTFDQKALADLVGLGKQCASGEEQELVLKALDGLAEQACRRANYRPGMLETIIEETVNMLSSRPHPEDFQSFRSAVSLLRRIVTYNPPPGSMENLVDQQRAVRALSALGQTVLSQVGDSTGVDYILMGYEETFNLALLNHPGLLTDVSQALLETGAVALDSRHYLFAVAALNRLLFIFEETTPMPDEGRVDMLGLLAHFWTASDDASSSSRLFARRCLGRLHLDAAALQSALQQAARHCQYTMQFDTADRLIRMAEDIGGKGLTG